MPRKPLTITHHFPYHITARSNNKEWFYLPIEHCWPIFISQLTEVNIRFHFQIHAFILMNNHYHLIGTASKNYPLPKVMEWLQRSLTRIINGKTGRINHLFGGPYKASLITNEDYYFHAIKYLYRNSIEANIVEFAEDYSFSSIKKSNLPLATPITEIQCKIPRNIDEFLNYLNTDYSIAAVAAIKCALEKKEFKFSSRLRKCLKKELLCN